MTKGTLPTHNLLHQFLFWNLYQFLFWNLHQFLGQVLFFSGSTQESRVRKGGRKGKGGKYMVNVRPWAFLPLIKGLCKVELISQAKFPVTWWLLLN
jgi:hypothetical protein